MTPAASEVASALADSDGQSADERLHAAEVAALYDNVVIGVLGALAAGAGLSFALVRLQATDPAVAVGWTALLAICATAHIVLRYAYGRAVQPQARWRLWGARFTFISLIEGMTWGWGSLYLVTIDRFDLTLLAVVVCYTIAVGAIPAFGSHKPAFAALFVCATLPKFIGSAMDSGRSTESFVLFTMISVFIVAMGALALRTNQNFRAMVGLQIETVALAEDLRVQKDRAEQANRAKSTFLAAASHDLRQPVHALGLFVGALRGVPLPPEALRLVEQIEGSTAALDGLFSAILDLSRLDAGVVDVRRRPFQIQPLLARVCQDYREEARDKGLDLVLHPSQARVFTDPTLMERILRNFIGNALRYTSAGRVVVGCRRRGDVVRIEVWDTGAGIRADQQDWVFQEYAQLDNPERDRSKGLGLGLAIVRRLSVLLDCPIDVRSRPGHGSCFSVTIPVTTAEADSLEPARSEDFSVGRRWLILVLDDEKAIREAMETLLTGWGHTVIAAGSGDEMVERLATHPRKPDLVICDYRLRGDENGIDAVERLRSEYNETIPAMLITGDTAPERLAEARDSGLLLLHKPVPNAKLRAAITHLVSAAESTAEALEDEMTG